MSRAFRKGWSRGVFYVSLWDSKKCYFYWLVELWNNIGIFYITNHIIDFYRSHRKLTHVPRLEIWYVFYMYNTFQFGADISNSRMWLVATVPDSVNLDKASPCLRHVRFLAGSVIMWREKKNKQGMILARILQSPPYSMWMEFCSSYGKQAKL